MHGTVAYRSTPLRPNVREKNSPVKYSKVKYTDIAKFAGHLPHRYGNSRAIWDHTVLAAIQQR